MMEELLGTSPQVFIGITLVLLGFAGFMTGQALATTWRPVWQVFFYSLLLGCADRFLTWALFQGELLLLSGYLIDTAAIFTIALLAFRFTLARRMTAQYPWLYERAGPFGWRARGTGS
tara:strand:+ start:14748 stop:15101 length:354 start_codon:yes stop_codon:yes gene_type:complete